MGARSAENFQYNSHVSIAFGARSAENFEIHDDIIHFLHSFFENQPMIDFQRRNDASSKSLTRDTFSLWKTAISSRSPPIAKKSH